MTDLIVVAAGETVDEVLASIGLALAEVTAVIPAAELMATVQAKAKILAAKPVSSLRNTKALLRGEDGAVTARIQKEVMLFSSHLESAAFREAAAAFLEKRAPDFSKLG